MLLVNKLAREECRCDDGEDSCKVYQNPAEGGFRYWCWIAEAERKICEQAGIELFYDDKQDRLWSHELCENYCHCSNIGMLPDGKDNTVNKSWLSKNQMNYGSHCQTWNSGDQRPWCYVGFDSPCVDRVKKNKYWPNSLSNAHASIPMQFQSQLPCDKDSQIDHILEAGKLCEDMSLLAEALFIIIIPVYLVHIVVIFKFISNRCGDSFQGAEQYAVILSTDDESDSDTSEGTAKKNDPRRSNADVTTGTVDVPSRI